MHCRLRGSGCRVFLLKDWYTLIDNDNLYQLMSFFDEIETTKYLQQGAGGMMQEEEGSFASRKLFKVLAVGLCPLFLLFCYFKLNPTSQLFELGVEIAKIHPVNISSDNMLLSPALGLYCKLALLFAVYFVIKYKNHLKLKLSGVGLYSIIVRFVLFSIVYAIYIYMFIFCSLDVSHGNRLLKFLSSNDYLLFIYYVMIFTLLYFFTSLFLWFLVRFPSEYKTRR